MSKKEFDTPYIPKKPFSDEEIAEGYRKMVEKDPADDIEEVAINFYGTLGLECHFGPGVLYEDKGQYLYNEYIARNLKGLHYSDDSKILRNHGWVIVGASIFDQHSNYVVISPKADPDLCAKLMNDKELAKAEARKLDEEHRRPHNFGFDFNVVTADMTATEVYEIQKKEEKKVEEYSHWDLPIYLRRAESRYFFKELAKRDGGMDLIMADMPDFVMDEDAREDVQRSELREWKEIVSDRAYWLPELGFDSEANKFYGYAEDLQYAWDTRRVGI